MTEQDFLSSTDLTSLVNYLVGKVSKRKLRLWACAVARLRWEEITDPRSRSAVETSEKYADGEATLEELLLAGREALGVVRGFGNSGPIRAYQSCDPDPWFHAVNLWTYTLVGERIALLREIVGNPFRPLSRPQVMPMPRYRNEWIDEPFPWLTTSVSHMAQTIYRERDFSALPMLADLVEENGCREEILLHHLRGEQEILREIPRQTQTVAPTLYKRLGWRLLSSPHTKGCWVLDILTGRN